MKGKIKQEEASTRAIPLGFGTHDIPYIIENAWQLDWFRDKVNRGEDAICGELVSDIEYNQGMVTGEQEPPLVDNFTPIAPNVTGYRGTFDGRGRKISGLYVNVGDSPWCGLFGHVASDGIVKNVTIRNSYISTSFADEKAIYVGGIAGRNDGVINGCDVNATICVKSDLFAMHLPGAIFCGGIAGSNGCSGSITECDTVDSIDVTCAADYVLCGGIAGSHMGDCIDGCSSSDSIEVCGCASYICCGGIAGSHMGISSDILLCHTRSSININANATFSINCGGIAGCSSGAAIVAGICASGSVDISGTAPIVNRDNITGKNLIR